MKTLTDLGRADGMSRRRFMNMAAGSCLGVRVMPYFGGLAGLLSRADGAPAMPGARAQHVIYLFMSGGMSHIDTFDPKPKKKDVMGPVEAISSNADGIQLGSYLPKTAGVMDKVCVINSMTSTNGAHEQGQYILHTSYALRGTIKHPSLGAWVMKMGGRINKEIPGYVAIDTSPEHSSGGFFGATFGAAPIGSPDEGLQDSQRPGEVSEDQFERRLVLADKLNRRFHERFPSADVKGYESLYQEAVRLMKSEDLKAFDLAGESGATRKLYGEGRFAQGCLLARRLVEHGVRFVEVQLGGWDTHYDNFTAVEGRCAEFDQAFPALLRDLEQKGLLDKTLVVVGTEFGRTPEIKKEHNDGRDHHPAAFSCLLAGGGVKGGFKYGETDARGARVKDKPVQIQDFNATIAHALGLNVDETVFSPSKRPFKIADKGQVVKELFG